MGVFLWRYLPLKNPFLRLNKKEWVLYLTSLTVVIASNFFAKEINVINILATALGVTALIFIAKGDVFGQVLCLIFATLYSITSFQHRYYSEIITYLGMTAPISVASIVTWIKNPVEKGKNVVKIRKFTLKEFALTTFLTAIVTFAFYFVLKFLNTPNLAVSTTSIATSFLASFMMLRRISYYAVGFALNDIVLIVLWSIASVKDLTCLSMVACFSMFLLNDLYGFTRWKKREKEQGIR